MEHEDFRLGISQIAVALFLALLPLVLSTFRIREELIWRSGDVVLFIFVVVFSATMSVWGYCLTKDGHPPRLRFFPTGARMVLVGGGVLSGAEACGVFPSAGVLHSGTGRVPHGLGSVAGCLSNRACARGSATSSPAQFVSRGKASEEKLCRSSAFRTDTT